MDGKPSREFESRPIRCPATSGDDIVRSRAQLLVGNSEVEQDAAQVRDPAKRHLRGHGLTDALVGMIRDQHAAARVSSRS